MTSLTINVNELIFLYQHLSDSSALQHVKIERNDKNFNHFIWPRNPEEVIAHFKLIIDRYRFSRSRCR